MHGSSTTRSDIYFTYPFLWDKGLCSTRLMGKDVAWLLAVPISRSEKEYARDFDPQQLEELFEESNVDIFNLNRQAVV